jgi:hypothetical protein
MKHQTYVPVSSSTVADEASEMLTHISDASSATVELDTGTYV